METIFFFLLKASSGIVLFYLVYWLFLRKETFFTANRLFLIASLITAVLLPLFPVQYSVLMESENNKTVFKTISDTFKNIPAVTPTDLPATNFNWQQAVLLVYLTGAAIFMFRLLSQTFILIHLMIKYSIKSKEGIRIVENDKYGLPFSFFNIVYINPKFHTQENLPEILAHEKVHIREKHWFDLLFIELLTVIFWFNPFIWFFERSIKQNHEYLADKAVLAQGHSTGRYQALLINQLMGMQIIGITNNLNFALNTNRLKMMTKKKTSASRQIKFTWALPAFALLLFAFAEPVYKTAENAQAAKELYSEYESSQKTIKMNGVVLDENGDPLPGTSVVVKGMTIGTVSDIDGKFQLEIPESKSVVLSFVGKNTFVDSYSDITSGDKNGNVYNRKYILKDVVIPIYNPGYSHEQMVPPPPPPPKVKKSEKSEESEAAPPLPPPPPASGKGEKEVFYIVEDMPKYPGGLEAMQDYIMKMQQKIAQSKGAKGWAKVSFTVNGKGQVTDIKIIEKENDDAAKGAVMIASGMPDWTPGKQRGKSVPVKFLLPVEFK